MVKKKYKSMDMEIILSCDKERYKTIARGTPFGALKKTARMLDYLGEDDVIEKLDNELKKWRREHKKRWRPVPNE